MNYIHRNPIDEESCRIRFVDTGEIQQFKAHEVYSLNESFGTIPNQAFTLHLTGIVPADKEDDWDPSITQQITKELNKWTSKETDTIYEANVVFALRSTLVVNIMRLYNVSRKVTHCWLKAYLQKRNFGIASSEYCKKVIEMAKGAGKVNVLFECFGREVIVKNEKLKFMMDNSQVLKLLISVKQRRKSQMNRRLKDHRRSVPISKHPMKMNQ